MNLNRTVIAFPNKMEVFLPSLKKKWANYLLLSNNKKPKEAQRYELHIPDAIPNECGDDHVVWETESIDFDGVLIGTHLKSNRNHHIGTMLFKTDRDIRLIHCIQNAHHAFDTSYEHIYGTNVFEILRQVKLNQVDLNFLFEMLLPETTNLSLRDQVLTAIKTFFKLETGIYLGKYSKGYIFELHLLGIKVILQITMTENGLKLDKTLVFNNPKLKIENLKPAEIAPLIDLDHLTKYINGEYK
jgi:hypothetical protein